MSDPVLVQAIRELQAKQNAAAGYFRKALDEERAARDQALSDLARIAGSLVQTRSGSRGLRSSGLAGESLHVRAPFSAGPNSPGVVRLEDIPGARLPYIFTVEIPIAATSTSVQEQSFLVTQEGPFVATRRFATFLSQHSFVYTNPETSIQTRFNGRSYGRWRPIHSVDDFNDSQHNARADSSGWFLTPAWDAASVAGTFMPTATFTPPGAASSFRTMEFDGYIEIYDAGSSMPRQNRPTPSSLWGPSAELGALDFFERGSVVTFRVQPTHPNNPSFGNVDGETVFPAVAAGVTAPYYPFVAGQFDPHEGIATPSGIRLDPGSADPPPAIYSPVTSDPITRLPEGILVLGYEGYRIVQPAGPTF